MSVPLLLRFNKGEIAALESRISKNQNKLIDLLPGSTDSPVDNGLSDQTTNSETQPIKLTDKKASQIVGDAAFRMKEISKWESLIKKDQEKLNIIKSLREKDWQELKNNYVWVWVVLAGTLGSIISILIRVEDFQKKKYKDPATPFLIGGFKPVIGGSFALFFFLLINSKLITVPSVENEVVVQQNYAGVPLQGSQITEDNSYIGQNGLSSANQKLLQTSTQINGQPEQLPRLTLLSTTDNRRLYFILAIAFLVGFSERLATDTISKLENTVGGNTSREQDSAKK